MRITHLVHQYPPDFIGGTEIYTQTVARAQVQAGEHVAVFVPSPAGDAGQLALTHAEPEDGVQVFRVPVGVRTPTQVFLQTFRQPDLLQSWRAVLKAQSPDIVHVEHLMGMPFADKQKN